MIEAGTKLPDAELTAPDGGSVKPSEYRGSKLVIFFYPKANTPGCTTESVEFSEAKAAFEKSGVKLLGVSADSPKKQSNFIAKHDLTVDIASDESTEWLESLGVWAEKKMYGKTFMGIIRSTLLVDEDGVVTRVWPKVKVKGHVDEVLASVQNG